eukprot:s843_g15.t1
MEAWVSLQQRSSGAQVPSCSALPSLAQPCTYSSLSAPSVAPSLLDRVRALVRVLARRAELAARVPFSGLHRIPGTSCSNTWLTSAQNSMRPLQAYRSLGDWPIATGCGESGCQLPCDHRKNVLDRLPFVGRSWYAKPVCAYLLEAGMAQWQHFMWSLDATAHVDQQCLEQVDGEGCSWRQTFTDAAGGTHWDHVFVTDLLSNSSYRPVHDIVGAEYVAVARIRQALAEVPRRYLKCIKSDCLVMQDVPKKYQPAVERLLKMSHRDGTPVYRYEEVTGRNPSEPNRGGGEWRTP